MLARDRAEAVVTAQELQRAIAARRALGRTTRPRGRGRATDDATAPPLAEAARVAPVLRRHDEQDPSRAH